jgi:3-oxoacyl-[acyl-carrier-protein] synthase I
MQEIIVAAHTIISPLGFTTEENYTNCLHGKSGIQTIPSPSLPHDPIWVSSFSKDVLQTNFSSIRSEKEYTTAEKLLILSIQDTLSQSTTDIQSKELLVIISTTKGNIDLLEETHKNKFPESRVQLWSLSDSIQRYFGTAHKPVLISNACISGVNALILATRLMRDGLYKHILVTGVDLASHFVIAGFQSFKAISSNPCKPFDKARDGINLGEGGASILLTSESLALKNKIKLLGGAVSNDANHISGPSRTGDGLYFAISHALTESGLSADQIDALNAHGTATLYNDEMESKAFKLAGLQNTTMNGLKGYFGHTLGAAGLIETIISLRSMQDNQLLPTLGYTSPGTPETVNISNQLVKKDIRYLLKTASGFGGCNGAIVLEKNV